MPRDDWAKAKTKDRMRRIVFNRTASRPRKHRKKAVAAGPPTIPIRLPIGRIVQIRHTVDEPWRGYELRRALKIFVPYPIVTDWVEMQHAGWWLRIPRPKRFRGQ